MKRLPSLGLPLASLIVLGAGQALADQQLLAARVEVAPVIDGRAADAAWARAGSVITHDAVAGIDVTLKAAYTDDEVFVLVQFPDPTESRRHKMAHWNKDIGIYEEGPEREDAFVLKWSMEPLPISLKLSADAPYKADIWYWKACRTDHAGYADDKVQVYNLTKSRKAKWLLSESGRTFYLTRSGDEGTSAYEAALYDGYAGDELPTYTFRSPSGSRADVRAKGEWRDGMWTVEFSRKLDTGHGDDVRFDRSGSYQFGVSRYELAGRDVDPAIEEPKFGAGEIGETLFLAFE